MKYWISVRLPVVTALRQPLFVYFVSVLWLSHCYDAVDANVVRRVDLFESGRSTGPKIVGGTPAAPGDYPFHVNAIDPLFCGGSLIYEDIVLTAAHCVGTFLAGVIIGGTMLDGTDAADILSVDFECLHPEYDEVNFVNDIMLVKLSDPASSPVVTLNFDPTVPAIGEVVTAIGFGDTTFGGDFSDVLLMVDVNIYTDEFCVNLNDGYIPDTMLCAGTPDGGRDSCQGDSGGPLLTSTNVQVGIVSNGDDCGLPNIPGIYTEVSAFQSFIRQGICDLSDNPPPDCGLTIVPTPEVTLILAPNDPATLPPAVTPVAVPTAPVNSPVISPVVGLTQIPIAAPTCSCPPYGKGKGVMKIGSKMTSKKSHKCGMTSTKGKGDHGTGGKGYYGKGKGNTDSYGKGKGNTDSYGKGKGTSDSYGKGNNGGKGYYGKGSKITAKNIFVMALRVSDVDNGLDAAIDRVAGSPEERNDGATLHQRGNSR